METLYAVLYLVGLAFFVLSLRSLTRPGTERRGNICLLFGVISFAAIIAPHLIDTHTDQSVLQFMAGLAIALVVTMGVRHRFWRGREWGFVAVRHFCAVTADKPELACLPI